MSCATINNNKQIDIKMSIASSRERVEQYVGNIKVIDVLFNIATLLRILQLNTAGFMKSPGVIFQ